MNPTDLVLALLLVVALVGVVLWRRRARKRLQPHVVVPPETPAAKIISLHAAAKPRRRPF